MAESNGRVNMIVLGIDPGKKGGLALVSHVDGFPARAVHSESMPETPEDVYWAVHGAIDRGACCAVLEKVWAAPAEGRVLGAQGMFSFGQSYGMVEMALVAMSIPYQLVVPQKWQKSLSYTRRKGSTKTEHKNALKAIAQRLFPGAKVTHAVADALLLAYYGRFVHQPEPVT